MDTVARIRMYNIRRGWTWQHGQCLLDMLVAMVVKMQKRRRQSNMATHSRASVVMISGHWHHSFACVVAAMRKCRNSGSRQGQILRNGDFLGEGWLLLTVKGALAISQCVSIVFGRSWAPVRNGRRRSRENGEGTAYRLHWYWFPAESKVLIIWSFDIHNFVNLNKPVWTESFDHPALRLSPPWLHEPPPVSDILRSGFAQNAFVIFIDCKSFSFWV